MDILPEEKAEFFTACGYLCAGSGARTGDRQMGEFHEQGSFWGVYGQLSGHETAGADGQSGRYFRKDSRPYDGGDELHSGASHIPL